MCLREFYWRKILPRKAVSTNHIQIYSADLLRQIRWTCLVSLSSQELKMCSPRHKLATIVSSNEVPLPLRYTLHNLPHVGSLCHSRRTEGEHSVQFAVLLKTWYYWDDALVERDEEQTTWILESSVPFEWIYLVRRSLGLIMGPGNWIT